MPTSEATRLLIVARAAAVDVDELPPPIQSLIETASEIVVITPELPGRLQWLASDIDRVRHEADERLRTVLRAWTAVATCSRPPREREH